MRRCRARTASNPDWARRKINVVKAFLKSTYRMVLEQQRPDRTFKPGEGLDIADYVLAGGGFPVTVKGAGVIGVDRRFRACRSARIMASSSPRCASIWASTGLSWHCRRKQNLELGAAPHPTVGTFSRIVTGEGKRSSADDPLSPSRYGERVRARGSANGAEVLHNVGGSSA